MTLYQRKFYSSNRLLKKAIPTNLANNFVEMPRSVKFLIQNLARRTPFRHRFISRLAKFVSSEIRSHDRSQSWLKCERVNVIRGVLQWRRVINKKNRKACRLQNDNQDHRECANRRNRKDRRERETETERETENI